jgi:hypothetical protein
MHGKVNYLAFSFFGHTYLIYYNSDDGVRDLQLVTKLAFNEVKDECEGVTQGLVSML